VVFGIAMLADAASWFRAFFRTSRDVADTAKDASATVHDLYDARTRLARQRVRRPPRCEFKIVRFTASLNSVVPTIQVDVDITNFESAPLTVFVLGINYLHPSRGHPLYHIENFTPLLIPSLATKRWPVSRALSPHEIKALSDVPDRPTAHAIGTLTALANFKRRDHIIEGIRNDNVDGRIEGDSPYVLLTPDEADFQRLLTHQLKERLKLDEPPPLPSGDALQ
jgi:hypothetical protein